MKKPDDIFLRLEIGRDFPNGRIVKFPDSAAEKLVCVNLLDRLKTVQP